MADKICHLCGTHYNDDPYFKEQPAHTSGKCLEILNFRVFELSITLQKAKDALKRAEKQYTKEVLK